jgi:hypothetical protein
LEFLKGHMTSSELKTRASFWFCFKHTNNTNNNMYPYGGGYPQPGGYPPTYGGGYPGTTTTTTYVSIPQSYVYNPSMYYYEVPYDPFMPFIPPMGKCLAKSLKLPIFETTK